MPGPTAKINFSVSARDWLHDLRLVRSALEAQIDRLDRLELEMDRLASLDGRDAGALAPGATPVALYLEIHPQPDGSARIIIDGGAKLLLAPRLADVFHYLASSEKDHTAKDGLPEWRSRMEIVRFLEKHAGKAFTTRYLNGMIYLLKKALHEAGYDARLIQSHRQKGVRFAYQGSPQTPVRS